MPAVSVTTTASTVVISLDKFQAALTDRAELMRTIALGQLVSVYRTFEEEGSPSGSWAPLAASTLRGKRYTAGHKLLILSGRLRNSIAADSTATTATVGTSVVYARVQQEGSGSAKVGKHRRSLLLHTHYGQREVTGANGKKFMVPTPLTTGAHRSIDKNGKRITVKAKYLGPRRQVSFDVQEHGGGIPARPFLVFRPEDPERIRETVQAFVDGAAEGAGLEVSQ